MKRLIFAIFVILVAQLLVLPCLANQAESDIEVARTQEYIAAATKKGAAKIDALKAYIQKFPDKNVKWTKLAYYQLAVEYFTVENYTEAVKYGETTLQMGAPGEGEEGRLYLIIANAYAIKNAPTYNQDKANSMIEKAINFAKSKNLNDVLSEAKKLKSKLSAPAAPKMTPEQKFKFHYSNEEYTDAITAFKALSPAEKNNTELHTFYANCLFKADQFDNAIKEYETIYAKNKTAIVATRQADIYIQKARRNKALLDKAISFYLEAHLLYQKEGNANNSKAAYKKAEFELFEKYGFNDKIKKINQDVQKQQSSSAQNASTIRRLKYELRKEENRINKEYTNNGIEPPDFENKKLDDLRTKIDQLESGASPQVSDAASKLENDRLQIQEELKKLLADAKKRLGM